MQEIDAISVDDDIVSLNATPTANATDNSGIVAPATTVSPCDSPPPLEPLGTTTTRAATTTTSISDADDADLPILIPEKVRPRVSASDYRVVTLEQLGFTTNACIFAIDKFEHDLDAAVEWLLTGGSEIAAMHEHEQQEQQVPQQSTTTTTTTNNNTTDDGGSDGDDEDDDTKQVYRSDSDASDAKSSSQLMHHAFAYTGGVDEFEEDFDYVANRREHMSVKPAPAATTCRDIELQELNLKSHHECDYDEDFDQTSTSFFNNTNNDNATCNPATVTATATATPSKRKKIRKILVELQSLFARLQYSNTRAVSTKALTDSFGWGGSQAAEQHDVHELNRYASCTATYVTPDVMIDQVAQCTIRCH
jgi:hypothetical protein